MSHHISFVFSAVFLFNVRFNSFLFTTGMFVIGHKTTSTTSSAISVAAVEVPEGRNIG